MNEIDETELLNKPILTQEELLWINEHPVIKVTAKTDVAPIEFSRAGEVIGFSVDYLNLVAENVGLKFEYVNGISWQKSQELLKSREIDISHNLIQTTERGEFLNFTTAYLELNQVFYGRSNEQDIKSVEDIRNKRIIVIEGWASSAIYSEKYPELEFVEILDMTDALLSISKGENDLLIVPDYLGDYVINTEFIQGVKQLGTIAFMNIDDTQYIKIASRNDWPLLNSILQKGMVSVSDEQYNEIAQKWLLPKRIDNTLDLTRAEANWLAQNPVIKIVVDKSIRPIEFINSDGEVSGIVGEYLDKLSYLLNVEFQWIENQNFDEGMRSIRNGDADIVTAVTPTEERKSYLTFTDKLIDVNTVIFTREGEEIYGNMEGLKGHSLAQVKGFVMTDRIKREFPEIEVVETENVVEAMKLVSGGVVDAYIGSIPITSYNIMIEGLTNLIVTGTTPYEGDISMGIRSELPLLASAMQKAIASISDVEKTQIIEKWIVLKAPQKQDLTLLWQIIIGALLVVVFVLFWNYSLRNEVMRLKSSEERFRQIAETVDGLFFITSPDLKQTIYVSPNFENWTKFSCAQLYENPFLWIDIIHPEDRDLYKYSVLRMVKSDYGFNFPDYRIIYKDGSVHWLSTQMHPVYEEGGKIKNVIGFSTDITERISSSAKLKEISNQFQNAFSYASQGMALIGIDGNFLRVNDALCDILGYDKVHLLNLTVMQITNKDDLKLSVTLMKEVLEGSRLIFELEERFIKSDGTEVPVQFNVSLVRDADDEPVHFVAQIQDLSDIKEREEQLRHSQKMDAVGQLTGGLAHDFNNILGIILGNLEILISTVPDEEKQKSRLTKAIKGVDRGSQLIKKLLSFSRNIPQELEIIMVNNSIKNFLEFIAKTLTVSINVKTELADNLWPIEIEAGGFEDAILNLSLNAKDAMPDGGYLTIKTENITLDNDYVNKNPGSKIGDHVVISVIDTGTGIETDLIDKVLEPFFTTKAVNKGTGLGLSMVHGFVQRSGGHMKIKSEAGIETSVKLYIPRSFKEDEFVNTPQLITKVLPTGKETILVVDDEQHLSEVAEKQLTHLGYSVFTANNIEHAMNILNSNESIDLLFNDIVMPDNQDGYKIASSARKINPSLKILLTSGYSQNVEGDIDDDELKLSLKKNILQKPYSQHDLASAVRHTLDKSER